jgi:hypothetical protein
MVSSRIFCIKLWKANASYCRCHAGNASFTWRITPFIAAERPALHLHARDHCKILCLCVLFAAVLVRFR